MNKSELVKEVAKKLKVPQKIVSDVISTTVDTIQKNVSKGKKVTLVGFGTFFLRKCAARTGRNPQTGEAVPIPARALPTFSVGKIFKSIVK